MFSKEHAQKIDEGHDTLETFARVLDLINNPKPFLDLHKQAREEMTLTQEKLKEHQEATAFISDYGNKKEELEKARTELEKDEEAHVNDVETFKAWRKEETQRLDNISNVLDEKQRQLDADIKKLAEDREEFTKEYSLKMTPIDDMHAQAKANVEATEASKKEVDAELKKLKKKLKNINRAAVEEDSEEAAA